MIEEKIKILFEEDLFCFPKWQQVFLLNCAKEMEKHRGEKSYICFGKSGPRIVWQKEVKE